MFADACGKVSEFSRPVVISTRHQDGTIKTECGTFIVLNRDGWIITAGHMYDSYVKYQGDRKKAEEIEELKKYVQTKKYVEEVAKERLGLVYEDEILFKAEE